MTRYINIHGIVLSPLGFLKPGSFYNTNNYGIYLVTLNQFTKLPPGTVLFSILGARKVIGSDNFDDDTRGGYMAWGFKTDPAGEILLEEGQ